jgi:AcrR family transcriptional regulator
MGRTPGGGASAGVGAEGKRRGRPDQSAERRREATDAALEVMRSQAARGLRSLLSIGKVAEHASIKRSTLNTDFDTVDDLILTVARERLFTSQGEGVRATYHDMISEYTRAGAPEARFVAAIAANFRAQLRYPTTIPFWQLHVVAATAADPGGDDLLPAALCDLRRSYYAELTEQNLPALHTALADLRRVPRDGFNEQTLVALILTLLNGAVIRHLVDPEAFPDPHETVGHAVLAMVLGLTTPDDPRLQASEDLTSWVRHEAVVTALDVLDGSASGGGDDRALILASLWQRVAPAAGTSREALDRAFAEQFPTLGHLWDAALRRLLQRRVDEVWRLRDRNTLPVLRMIAENLLATREKHPGLVVECTATRSDLAGGHLLDDVEAKMADLLTLLDEPTEWADLLLQDCLRGDRRRVELFLTGKVGRGGPAAPVTG